MKKIRVGVLGATGMVGQRFILLLQNHPWFELSVLAASSRSAGKPYAEAVKSRWNMDDPIPDSVAAMPVLAVEADIKSIVSGVDLVFCALDMSSEDIRAIEISYADAGVAVVSNNSAHRWTADVPIIMPEINPDHLALIDTQRSNRNWSTGLIAVKPNCSIQSYVTILSALEAFGPLEVAVTSLQAISGAGKTFASWPEMQGNVIPYIGGEETKSEREPLKIWGHIANGTIVDAHAPKISATCIRIPVLNGHIASVSVKFADKPTQSQILGALSNYQNPIQTLKLPSAPAQLITYLGEPDRPQISLDIESENGMGISMGRLREDPFFDWQFIALAHNTIRGAAGGAVLTAELLMAKGYVHAE